VENETDPNETAPESAPPLGETAATTKASRAPQRSFDQQLAGAQLAIESALSNPTIMELLMPFSYTHERLSSEGQQLIAEAQQRMSEQSQATGDMFSAKDERDRVRAIAREQYGRDLALARVALRGDRGALQKLELHDPRKVTQAGWLLQARRFYSNAIGDPLLQQRLAEAALSLDKLEGGRGLIEQLSHCMARQAAARSAAKQATQRRGEAMQRLNAWLRDFRAIARVALRGRPELLRQLGM
jgi:hypothetical protein